MPSKLHNHIQSKLQQQYLEHGINCETEWVEGSRRADLYLLRQKLAIEIQTSPIKYKEIVQRTLDWNGVGVSVVWIFAGRKFLSYGRPRSKLVSPPKSLRKLSEKWSKGYYIYEGERIWKIVMGEYEKFRRFKIKGHQVVKQYFRYKREGAYLDGLEPLDIEDTSNHHLSTMTKQS